MCTAVYYLSAWTKGIKKTVKQQKGREIMAAVRMAVMEIGAQDVIMKVYEIAPRKGMQVIDCLRRMVPVGKDTYSEGRISTQVL